MSSTRDGVTAERTRCRSCDASSLKTFLSLGDLPLPDALLTVDELADPEPRYPTHVAFCTACSLVQLLADVPAERMFVDNYLYFSSYSDQLLAHAKRHTDELLMDRDLDASSLVVEVASNDGYLLRNLVDAGIPVLGIDPAPEPARAARDIGVPTVEAFFGQQLARELVDAGRRADVIIANNVMAHVPDLGDFVAGMDMLLADDGVITVENPYVRDLIDHIEFDTIYHEHVCYYSCTSVDNLVRQHGLHLNDAEPFPALHGGTLRWWISKQPGRSDRLAGLLEAEQRDGLTELGYYQGFAGRVERLRTDLRELIVALRQRGASIAAYGAAAKGTVLLNHVGLDSDLIDFIVDRNPHKQGRYMPGVHIPISAPDRLVEVRPDYVLLLAWNFTDEILSQQGEYIDLGGRFIRPIPDPVILPEGPA